jgi:hypothetical protein
MVGTMPILFEKGPYLEVMEDFVNGSPARMKKALKGLRDGKSILDLGGLDTASIDGANLSEHSPSVQELIDFTKEQWFGHQAPPAGASARSRKWSPQPEFHARANRTTGHWTGWYGDADAILRETLVRGLEVAMGLSHGEVPSGRTPRQWVVEGFWVSPSPWLEGFVTWRPTGKRRTDGKVTIVIATPGTGMPVKNSPTRANPAPDTGYEVDPTGGPEVDHGLWVVSHRYHRPETQSLIEPSALGDWAYPTDALTYESQGEVVCVSPSELEGGVLSTSRQWAARPKER